MPDLRVRQLRIPRSRPRERRFRTAWAGSAAAHVLVLLLLLLVRTGTPPAAPEEPSFAVEFEAGAGNPQAVPGPPPPPSGFQMNLIPPEFVQPPPQPQEGEPMPRPIPRPRYARTPSRGTDRNPFAHPMNFSLAPREQLHATGGGPTRGLDLSAGPVVRGGRLMESISHTISPGGVGDYMALLQDFVEEHKYYPEGAIRNEEQGGATVEVTVLRDGRVKAVTLVDSSGSHLLDAAWMSVFRDNRLPPLSDDIPGPEFTFRYRLNYELIYGRFGQ